MRARAHESSVRAAAWKGAITVPTEPRPTPAEPSQVGDDPIAAIETAVRDYVEGWYEGDAHRMARALHDSLAKRIRSDEDTAGLRDVTKERMVELTAAGGGESPGAAYEIEVHHVSDEIATAQVHSLEYLDYLHLVDTGEGWKIANILFRTHA